MVSILKNKAIFLDRDGVINYERGEYTFHLSDFKIIEGVLESLKNWSEKGYLIIIISNQGGIGKGLYSTKEVQTINHFLIGEFSKNEISLADFYYCPHHPDFTGNCICRKPESVLFEKALAKFDIDPLKSFMIGDKPRDIIPAEKLGITGFLIEANSSLKKLLPLIP
jgi:D-glycero-D-manno-heptose 1,7-bisphosphate phosphatase